MPRALHADTKVQRGSPETAAPEPRARGFEPSDARAKPVLIALGGFLGLMLLGLACAAATLAWLHGREATPPAPMRQRVAAPPPPNLLAAPTAARLAYERARQRPPDAAALARAQRAVMARGWDPQPAPAATAVARAHREALR